MKILSTIALLATLGLCEKFTPKFHYTHTGNTVLDPIALFRDLNGNFNLFYLHNDGLDSKNSSLYLNWGHA